MAEFSGTPSGSGRRVAVVASRFNENVTRRLVDGAMDALVRHGAAFEDVRALGFLRPPWVLAYDQVFQGAWPAPASQ